MFTVLVIGSLSENQTSQFDVNILDSSLEAAINSARIGCSEIKQEMRLLVGNGRRMDVVAANLAHKLAIPVHRLAHGNPRDQHADTCSAQRVVWLGAPDSNTAEIGARSLISSISVALADMLILIEDDNSLATADSELSEIGYLAARAMKPVVAIGQAGSICLLDRGKLDDSMLHRLESLPVESGLLSICFSPPLSESELLRQVGKEISNIADPYASATGTGLERLREFGSASPLGTNVTRAGQIHDAMMSLACFDFKRMFRQFQARVMKPYWGPANPIDSSVIFQTPVLNECFAQSDVKSNAAAGHHRDLTWIIYIASALAVFSAVAGEIGLWPGEHGYFWASAELVLIGGVISLVSLAKRKRWHSKWIGHRFVAEQVRYARMCLPFLVVPKLFLQSPWKVVRKPDGQSSVVLASAELWCAQRALSAEGLPVGNGRELICYTPSSISALKAYVISVVEDQHSYHHRNHHRLHEVHHHLHMFSLLLFVASAISVFAHFFVHASWLLVCTAFFPALAAAVHGITTKLEIVRLAGQSEATAGHLQSLLAAIEHDRDSNDWAAWLQLRMQVLAAAALMSDENGQWQQLVQYQDAELPA